MIIINESEEIKAQLEAEGKVTHLSEPEHIAASVALNDQMNAVRKEYQVKDRKSQLAASMVILTS